MKNRFLPMRIVLLVWAVASSATAQTMLVDYYSNNLGPRSPVDQIVRLINVGQQGTPLTSPIGDVCANIYVFDNAQEMIACCSCRLTPNELASASVGKQLTSNPLISVIPPAGVILILPITTTGSNPCSPVAPFATPDASLVDASSIHLGVSGANAFMTENALRSASLSSQESGFLTNSCLFVQYLGNSAGKGGCGCSTPGS